MGDRCVIQVKGASCSMYLHWHGGSALEILKSAVPRMRAGDENYSQARLIGVAHGLIEGNLSLGVLPPVSDPPTEEDSQGNAGVIVYDCSSGTARCYHGYLADKHKRQLQIGTPPG